MSENWTWTNKDWIASFNFHSPLILLVIYLLTSVKNASPRDQKSLNFLCVILVVQFQTLYNEQGMTPLKLRSLEPLTLCFSSVHYFVYFSCKSSFSL